MGLPKSFRFIKHFFIHLTAKKIFFSAQAAILKEKIIDNMLVLSFA
jgi:hypothetical protein